MIGNLYKISLDGSDYLRCYDIQENEILVFVCKKSLFFEYQYLFMRGNGEFFEIFLRHDGELEKFGLISLEKE